MNALLQDFRYGLRMLRANRSLAIVAILALALGIGANTAVFSVVNAVLLRPLPYAQSDRLVVIWGNFLKLNIERLPAKAAEYLDYRDQTRSFDAVAASSSVDYNLSGGDRPARVAGTRVTANLFPMLGGRVLHGRGFTPDDNRPGSDQVAIVSHVFWQQRLGGDPNLAGRTITLNDRPYAVIGVMEPGFQYPHPSFPFGEAADLWTPLAFTPEQITERRRPYFLNVIGRLKPGVTIEQARAEMSVIAKRFEEQHRSYRGPGNSDGGWRITLHPLGEEVTGGSRFALLLLAGAVALVLLIACANVANLLLVRATERQRELAIRTALGASRLRIARQLLVESLTLALLGGAFGLLLAWWGVDALRALNIDNLPRLDEANLDWRVLAFTAAISLLTGLLFGVLPAWQASKPDVRRMLNEGGATATRRRHWPRNLLVVTEVAIAVLLLAGAGLLINSFLRLQRARSGVDVNKLLFAELSLPRARYPDTSQIVAFYRDLIQRVEALPGVERASAGNLIPLSGTVTNDPFAVEGRPLDFNNAPNAGWQLITPNHFRTLGIPLLRGRDFSADDKLEAAIINETMARKYWPNEDPIGKRISLGIPRPDNPWKTIVGIVADTPQRTLESKPGADWYLPLTAQEHHTHRLFVRAAGDPAGLIAAVREQVWAVDKDQPVMNVTTMRDFVADSLAARRFNTMLLGIFAAVALLLAALGIFSVISYSVTQRTQEIGVRMALGAQTKDVLWLVVRQGMSLVAIGIALGLIAAFALTRVMKSLLFEVSATDPLTFALIALLLGGVAFCACWIPARRAAKVDPMVALRRE